MTDRPPEAGRVVGVLEVLGLRRPRSGSLGSAFAAVLVGGAVLAAAAGAGAGAGAPRTWQALVSVIVWQPAIEELLFRGVLQGELRRFQRLRHAWQGMTGANLVAATIFSAFHFVHQPPAWALATLLPGLVFGFFRDRSESTWPATALHIAYNGAFFLAL